MPWRTTQEKKSVSRNNSPDRTVRLNTALNIALIVILAISANVFEIFRLKARTRKLSCG